MTDVATLELNYDESYEIEIRDEIATTLLYADFNSDGGARLTLNGCDTPEIASAKYWKSRAVFFYMIADAMLEARK